MKLIQCMKNGVSIILVIAMICFFTACSTGGGGGGGGGGETSTTGELNENGFDAMEAEDWAGALDWFEQAVAAIDGSTPQDDADVARALYAGLTLIVLGEDIDNGANILGQFLNGVEINGGTTRSPGRDIEFSDGTPSLAEVQAWLGGGFTTTLQNALTQLNAVSENVLQEVTFDDEQGPVLVDYADVLFFSAIINTTLFTAAVLNAYNIAVENQWFEDNPDFDSDDLLGDHLDFMNLADGYAAQLLAAKGYLQAAVNNLDAALDWIEARTGGGAYNIEIDDWSAQEIANARTIFEDILTALTTPETWDADAWDFQDLTDRLVDLTVFFNGLDLHDLIPEIDENGSIGDYPDDEFDGLVVPGLEEQPLL